MQMSLFSRLPYCVGCECFINLHYVSVMNATSTMHEQASMEGSCRALSQYDSEETQPPDVPLDVPAADIAPRHLEPGTDSWYVSYTLIMPNIVPHLLINFASLHCRFGNRDVSRAISEIIKSHYLQPFTCWKDAPADHRAFWWNSFKVSMKSWLTD